MLIRSSQDAWESREGRARGRALPASCSQPRHGRSQVLSLWLPGSGFQDNQIQVTAWKSAHPTCTQLLLQQNQVGVG